MENGFNVAEAVELLNAGKEVKCNKCGEGKYVTAKGYLGKSKSFWCDKCGDNISVTPGDVIVE